MLPCLARLSELSLGINSMLHLIYNYDSNYLFSEKKVTLLTCDFLVLTLVHFKCICEYISVVFSLTSPLQISPNDW